MTAQIKTEILKIQDPETYIKVRVSNNIDYFNYQHNFSKSLIEETQNKYGFSYENEVYFLENKKASIIIDPKTQKDISLRVFHKASNPTTEIEKGSYYLTGKIVFPVDYFPKEFINCLEKQGFIILNEIEIPKTGIDINKFFLKEIKRILIPKNLEDKFKYDDKGNIVPKSK
ncbi:hypothetical protein [Chryseobacterium pennipullorum]|uniref:Uncharacterized protein n=1 Tax=Chryseobacterium pennipullorum TaxID=2258963 RepID=A0A3D9BAQ8_9FLAO|nr:hypothetical protein [Chryseobacterium pennipullorum]REC50332.1 hypothetical protein DRF67_02040 [Chryseobacterium pennipullorum]